MRPSKSNVGIIPMRPVTIHRVPPASSGVVRRLSYPASFGVVRRLSALAIAAVTFTAPLLGQSIQYKSPSGVEYRAQRDTGAVARAESALAADPRNVDRVIALGVAQSGVRQYREAIETFTRGLKIAPNNALLYGWRGNRYLSMRQLEKPL